MSNYKARLFRAAAIFIVMSATISNASAQRSRGGGGGGARASSGGSHRSASAGGSHNRAGGGAHSQRTASASRHAGATHAGARGSNVNRSANVNNVNVNRNVNVSGNGYGYGRGYHPVARAATVGAIAVTTGAIIGSTYHSLPSNCSTVVRAGGTYHHCGSAWYQTHNGEYIAVVAP